jgi:hypothetical protein
MRSYRLYSLDGAGNITMAEWLEALDDGDALREARKRQDSVVLELWDRSRLVGRIEPSRRG